MAIITILIGLGIGGYLGWLFILRRHIPIEEIVSDDAKRKVQLYDQIADPLDGYEYVYKLIEEGKQTRVYRYSDWLTPPHRLLGWQNSQYFKIQIGWNPPKTYVVDFLNPNLSGLVKEND